MKISISKIKSTLKNNNKITKAISVLSLILIMSGLFAFIIAGLYSFDLIELPEFIQNIFFKTDGSKPGGEKYDGNIYQFMQDYAKTGNDDGYISGFTLEITLENIRGIIANTKLPDNLYLETEAEYYDGGGRISKTEVMLIWKKGGKYRYELSVNSRKEELFINDSKNEYIQNFITRDSLTKAASDTFSFDNIPHIPNINYYLDLLESGEIVNCAVMADRESNIVRIKYANPLLDQRELIEISLDTGIVVYVECSVGDDNDLFYKSRTKIIEAYYDGDRQSKEKTLIRDDLFAVE